MNSEELIIQPYLEDKNIESAKITTHKNIFFIRDGDIWGRVDLKKEYDEQDPYYVYEVYEDSEDNMEPELLLTFGSLERCYDALEEYIEYTKAITEDPEELSTISFEIYKRSRSHGNKIFYEEHDNPFDLHYC